MTFAQTQDMYFYSDRSQTYGCVFEGTLAEMGYARYEVDSDD